ncbi:MAG: VWA domain-containing protein, partial [Acidobacteria bacterium]|nr:VWA domain-containing protein [Acidobacteriota bacterium]
MNQPLETAWRNAWPAAIGCWSRYTQLRTPLFCHTVADEKREGLTSSFAMIRLLDHAVVVSLRQVLEMKIGGFPREILAHEVGHHVLCPGDLGDHARLIARLRRGLPGQEAQAGLVANLYADLLINDRLQRLGLSIAGVYAALPRSEDKLWTFYMRIYEILWSLQRKSLAAGLIEPALEGDAQLGAKLVKVYAKDWLKGAGRFAALVHPYLREDGGAAVRKLFKGWLDVDGGPGGDGIPDGLASLDDDEEEGNIHPALDPDLARDGVEAEAGEEDGTFGRNRRGSGRTNPHRQPSEYAEI